MNRERDLEWRCHETGGCECQNSEATSETNHLYICQSMNDVEVH